MIIYSRYHVACNIQVCAINMILRLTRMCSLRGICYTHDNAMVCRHFWHYWPLVRRNQLYPPVAGEFPSQKLVTCSFDDSFVVSINRLFDKRSMFWDAMALMWRQCDALADNTTEQQGQPLWWFICGCNVTWNMSHNARTVLQLLVKLLLKKFRRSVTHWCLCY